MRVLRAKVPSAVYQLNDEPVARWREGDQSVWNEDAKGGPPGRWPAVRVRRPAPPPNSQWMDRPDPQADIEWEAEAD